MAEDDSGHDAEAMFTRILAGVDETTRSRDAAALADLLAQASRADLMLVAAYQDPLLPFPLTFGSAARRRVDDAHTLLDLARSVHAPHGHTRAVPDFSPARALRRTARDEHADLVVLGSSRSAPAGQARAGRTGRQILHDASFAVAFAAAERRTPGAILRRVIVGVDDSPEAVLALRTAEQIAGGCEAEVMAVGVAEGSGEMAERCRERAALHLDGVLAGSPGTGREVRVGEPAQQLALAALDADLLVIGSRRWGHPGRIAMGSTGETLCQAAPCSVLVLPRVVSIDPPAPATAGHRLDAGSR
jgi:nucleotide-binding universal stress UspA family protein